MQKLIERVMSTEEAEAMDARIIGYSDDWYRSVAPLIIEMREREGYKALGHGSFKDYCASIDKRLGHSSTQRLQARAEVEANLGVELPAQHAYVLARSPSAEAQQQVFDFVKRDFPNPIERNYETAVDRWFRDHDETRVIGVGQATKTAGHAAIWRPIRRLPKPSTGSRKCTATKTARPSRTVRSGCPAKT